MAKKKTTKKEYTFADQAKAIAKMYPRRETDSIELRDYKQAMNDLMAEQESAREAMGLTQQQEPSMQGLSNSMAAYGGKMKYQTGGPFGFLTENQMDFINAPRQLGQGTVPADVQLQNPQLGPQQTLETDKLATFGENQVARANDMPTGDNFFERNQQYMPSAISGLSNIGGNLLMAALSKKNQPTISASMMTPREVNLAGAREQARRDAAVSRNINIRNARNLGLGSGATMGNIAAANAAIDRNLGRNIMGSNIAEEQANVQSANQAAAMNAQAVNRAGMMNTQLQQQGLQNRLGYLSGALGTIPGVMRDINMINADEKTRMMYENILPLLGRNYGYTGSLFSNMPVSRYIRG